LAGPQFSATCGQLKIAPESRYACLRSFNATKVLTRCGRGDTADACAGRSRWPKCAEAADRDADLCQSSAQRAAPSGSHPANERPTNDQKTRLPSGNRASNDLHFLVPASAAPISWEPPGSAVIQPREQGWAADYSARSDDADDTAAGHSGQRPAGLRKRRQPLRILPARPHRTELRRARSRPSPCVRFCR
jgi:hypothetical protein